MWPRQIQKWNAAHPNEKVTLKEQTDQADQQHDDIVQHMQAKDAGYDIVTVDVDLDRRVRRQGLAGAAEGQRSRWTPRSCSSRPSTRPPTTARSTRRRYASDGGLLYYRKDLVPTPPKTWAS